MPVARTIQHQKLEFEFVAPDLRLGVLDVTNLNHRPLPDGWLSAIDQRLKLNRATSGESIRRPAVRA